MMTFLKVLHPLIRQRTPAIQKNVLFNSFKRLDSNKQSSVVKSARRDVDTNVKPLGEKIKDTTKTASYLGVILVGVGVTGALLYAVFRELFSSTSSNNIYSAAVEKCKNDTRVQDKLGLPITAFGAETRRRRRQHVSHVKFLRDGKQCISMVFHLKGSFHQGLVQLEKTETTSGNFEYRYLFVKVDDLLQTTIILEDNRDRLDALQTSSLEEYPM